MATLKTREIRSSLLKKGFVARNNDHEYFQLVVDGKGTQIKTHISHGEIEIDDSLISRMGKQTYLSKSEFMDLVNCPLSKEAYIEMLIGKGLVTILT